MFVFGSRRGTLSRFIVKWFTHFTTLQHEREVNVLGGIYGDIVCNDLAVSLLCWLRAKCPGLSCVWVDGETTSQSSSLNRNERWSFKLPTCSPILPFFCVRVWSLSQSDMSLVLFVSEREYPLCVFLVLLCSIISTMSWLGGVGKLETNLCFLVNHHLAHFWTFFCCFLLYSLFPRVPHHATPATQPGNYKFSHFFVTLKQLRGRNFLNLRCWNGGNLYRNLNHKFLFI